MPTKLYLEDPRRLLQPVLGILGVLVEQMPLRQNDECLPLQRRLLVLPRLFQYLPRGDAF